ncbi:hypothetical protein SAMN05192574_102394 [Mucilaginibacter gossypiicola]|uniref:Uncharacterized protein n=1 Tax=Mucilaginibacter gossypiicola TaxID=551995 RepID=A0A1H8DLS4_9SPHI|nr:hypothetical protein [Mucilaginibacter gossypiicola]SEN08116.1 hypothetical protein SAMN05192574_102394 [Mucilaginibacter gossypiicola]
MRKFGAICLASFYLLLTTGMFVCLVHCSAEYLLGSPAQASVAHQDGDQDDHDHEAMPPAGHDKDPKEGKTHDHKNSCGEGKNCSCCNQHDNYVIKENTSGAEAFQLNASLVATFPLPYYSLKPVAGVYLAKVSWLNTTGPPRATVQPLFIFNRSLLI